MQRVVVTPLARISEEFSRIARGDLETRVGIYSKVEIGDLFTYTASHALTSPRIIISTAYTPHPAH